MKQAAKTFTYTSHFVSLLVLLFCIGWIFQGVAWAHNVNMTGLKIRIEKKEITVSVVAHQHNFKTSDPQTEITDRLKLQLNGAPFSPRKIQLIRDPANGIVMWQGEQALPKTTAAPVIEIEAPLFPEVSSDSTIVTVFKDRQLLKEAVVDAEHPTATIGKSEAKNSVLSVVGQFVREGIGHIFGGIDHVLFLLSLLLLGGGWKKLLKIVTAFTLAHSITLSLAATGVFTLPPRLVEPVIALSIVAVAVTNFRGRPEENKADLRPWMAFGFGLIHGFGFAGALAEVGLPREALGWALVAFNCGVEIGQATLVLIFAPTLAAIVQRWPKWQLPIVRFGSGAVACMGFYWFVERILSK